MKLDRQADALAEMYRQKKKAHKVRHSFWLQLRDLRTAALKAGLKRRKK